MAIRWKSSLGVLCLVFGLTGVSQAHADITGEWLTSSGQLVFEPLGGSRYHAVWSFNEALPGQVPIEFDSTLNGLVFEGHWISLPPRGLGVSDCHTTQSCSVC